MRFRDIADRYVKREPRERVRRSPVKPRRKMWSRGGPVAGTVRKFGQPKDRKFGQPKDRIAKAGRVRTKFKIGRSLFK